MKNIKNINLAFAILSLCLVCLYSSAQTSYTSRTGATTCRQVTLTWSGSDVTVDRANITCTDEIFSTFYNVAGVSVSEGTISYPNDGNKYWFIPFTNDNPVEMDEPWCLRCDCDAAGSCNLVNLGTWWCVPTSCQGCCLMVLYLCGGALQISGGGILVQANSVTVR